MMQDLDSERGRSDAYANKILKLESELAELKKDLEELQIQIGDLKQEKHILIKKCQVEVRDIKNELTKEKSNYEVLLKEKNQLEKDYKIVMGKLRHEASSTMNESTAGKSAGPGKQEKIILEALSNRVNELEVY